MYRAATEYDHSGIRERVVFRPRAASGRGHGDARAEPPCGLLVNIFCAVFESELRKQIGAGGESGAAKLIALAEWVEQPAAVIIAGTKQTARGSGERIQIAGHLQQLRVQPRGAAGEHVIQQKHIERVDVVVSRLLEVAAIRLDLKIQLLFDDAAACADEAARARHLRVHAADRVKGESFAEQVRVGREIHRKIGFEMPRVQP